MIQTQDQCLSKLIHHTHLKHRTLKGGMVYRATLPHTSKKCWFCTVRTVGNYFRLCYLCTDNTHKTDGVKGG